MTPVAHKATCDTPLTVSTHSLDAFAVASGLWLLEGGRLQTVPLCTHLEATLCSGRQGLRDEKQVLTLNVCAFSGCLAGIL